MSIFCHYEFALPTSCGSVRPFFAAAWSVWRRFSIEFTQLTTNCDVDLQKWPSCMVSVSRTVVMMVGGRRQCGAGGVGELLLLAPLLEHVEWVEDGNDEADGEKDQRAREQDERDGGQQQRLGVTTGPSGAGGTVPRVTRGRHRQLDVVVVSLIQHRRLIIGPTHLDSDITLSYSGKFLAAPSSVPGLPAD